MLDDLIRTARQLAGEGRPDAAIALFEVAGADGSASAWAELATWLLRGDSIPRDLVRARAALDAAVAIGHVDAALLQVALTASGDGGVADWAAAVTLLQRAAANDPVAAEQLQLLQAMQLDDEGYPSTLPEVEVLCATPYVARARSAVSPAECRHIAGVANPLLEPGVVVDPRTRKSILHPVRTSYTATVGPAQETPPIAALNRRFAAITRTPLENGEPLQVLRYTPSQEFKLHSDALPGAANQRTVTAIAYLNDGFIGGETAFPVAGLNVAPRAGDVLIFHNADGSGNADPRARHAGLPVTHGVKWIATRWIRQSAFDPWQGKQ